MPPEDNGGAPAPDVPAAPADNGGVPAAPAPADPAPAPAAPAEPQAPANPTIQPGQSPTDLDFDAMLDEIDQELANEDGQQPPADPNNPEGEQPPADPNNPDGQQPNGEQQPQQPQQPEQPPAPADPAALPENEFVELDDYDRYFNVAENEELGIRPIGEIRNPEQGESAQDYFKNVTTPAVVQLVKNMTGFATHNQQVTERQAEAQAAERDTNTIAEIDGLIKSGAMPAYTMKDGSVDPSSEGGKVIGEVLKMATEHNQKPENANHRITSFSHAYHQLYKPAQEQAAKDAKKNEQHQRRSNANAVLNGGRTNGAGAGGRPQAQSIRKGQSVTDLDFENMLS